VPVKRKLPKERKGIDPAVWAVLNDEPLPDGANKFTEFDLWPIKERERPRKIWEQYRDDVLAAFIDKHPGRRPSRWWAYETHELRQRLGGVGTRAHEHLAFQPFQRAMGVYSCWIGADDVRLWKLRCPAVDLNDPPVFESQASYLKRHGLLFPGEAEQLSEADFAPETLFDILDYGEDLNGPLSLTFGKPRRKEQ
jgi:hypothetical protein